MPCPTGAVTAKVPDASTVVMVLAVPFPQRGCCPPDEFVHPLVTIDPPLPA